MITARFYRAGGRIRAFRVLGHAGYSAKGTDIVCAAVSVLSQSIANGLMRARVPLAYSMDEGRLEVFIRPKTVKQTVIAEALTETLYQAVEEIAGRHPKYVRLLNS